MKNIKKAFNYIFISALFNTIISILCLIFKGLPEFKGYFIGTSLSFILSFLWMIGVRKGIKSNTMVLLMFTLGGFPVRLIILAIFALSGLYILKMDLIYFAISFLVGTIISLIIEVWFLNTLSFSTKKKL